MIEEVVSFYGIVQTLFMEKTNKYFEDKKFIQWVFNSNEDLEEWWKLFETNNPNEKQTILKARSNILNFKTLDKKISDEEKMLLFSKILKQIERGQKPQEILKYITGMLKYAAVAILFFAIGALLF